MVTILDFEFSMMAKLKSNNSIALSMLILVEKDTLFVFQGDIDAEKMQVLFAKMPLVAILEIALEKS